MTNRNIRNRMFHQHLIKICFLTLICLVFVGCENKDYIYSSEHGTEQISNRPTETSEATVSPTATTDPTLTVSPTATTDPTLTVSPTATTSPTPTASPTPTTSPTPTASPAPTASPTPATKPQPVAAGTKIENNIYYAKSGNTASFPDFSGLAFIISDSDGTVLMSKNQNMTIYPASTMKMLTALTALDYLSMDTVITATADMLVKTGNYYEYGVVPGTSYTLSTWIHILMMNSAGDAANIIAHAAGKVIAGNDSGGIAEFVVAMNKKAKSLGMNDTCVDNAVGIDIGDNYTNMYTTAEDMTKLARAYMNVEALAEVVKKENYVVPNCEKQAGKTIYSTNYFLIKKTEFASDYFYSIGTKSGQTNAAGHCFVATVIAKDGRQLTCACYGLDQGENSRWILFYQMRALLEYCIKNEK